MKYRLKSFIRALLPRSVKKHRILGGLCQGKWIVTSWHDYPRAIMGVDSKPLLDWLTQNVKPGETWLDVGTHYGYVALALSQMVGITGRVFAFEPMLRTAGCVQQTRQLNNLPQLTIIPLALADPEVISLQQLSATKGMIDSTIGLKEWKETFFAARLDWLWPHICGQSSWVDGVKIDVQGMEIEAVRGMRALLEANKPKLIIELHQGVSREALLDLVEDMGYRREAIPVDPVEGEIQPLYLADRSYAFQAC